MEILLNGKFYCKASNLKTFRQIKQDAAQFGQSAADQIITKIFWILTDKELPDDQNVKLALDVGDKLILVRKFILKDVIANRWGYTCYSDYEERKPAA